MHRTILLALLHICSVVGSLHAVEPTMCSLNIRGLQVGATTTLIIDGTDLLPNPRLLLPFEVARQELPAGGTATRAVFEVAVDEQVVPGVYNLRLATDDGVTSPVVIGVDRLPQLPLAAEVAELPVALHGAVAGSAIVSTRFPGKAGQEVAIEVEAQRLGSKLRPVVHLYDTRRVQLAWAWPTPALYGDARLTAKLPADGAYTIELHDAEYAAPAAGFFRLKVGTWHTGEAVFPLAIERGSTAALELLGILSATPVQVIPADIGSCMPIPWLDAPLASGLRPRVQLSDSPELLEPAASAAPSDLPAAPIAVNGRLANPGEEDRYRLAVTPGSKLRFELFAERNGSPLDAVLAVRNEQGQPLARGDDGPGTTDPLLDFTVPDNVTSLVLAVSDLHGRGGQRCIYRLAVEVTGESKRRDFELTLSTDRLRVARNGRAVAAVIADRRGYDGPIRLAFDRLPAGVSLAGDEIPVGAEGTLLALTGSEGSLEQLLASLRGTGDEGKLQRLVAMPDHPIGSLQPWLRHELALAATAASPFAADVGELSSDAQLVLGGKLPLPIKLVRGERQAGPVRLSLLSSQNVPKAAGRPDVNKSLRAEAAVEIAADKSEGQVVVVVPPDLPGKLYDLALQAELLSADKQKVLATAHTSVKRLNVLNPINLQLAGGLRYEATLDAKTGAMVKVAGKIERRGDFKGDVTVTTAPLPAGIKTTPVVLKPDMVDFELALTIPANVKPGDISGIKLFCTAAPDPRLPQALARSSEVEITIAIIGPQ